MLWISKPVFGTWETLRITKTGHNKESMEEYQVPVLVFNPTGNKGLTLPAQGVRAQNLNIKNTTYFIYSTHQLIQKKRTWMEYVNPLVLVLVRMRRALCSLYIIVCDIQ